MGFIKEEIHRDTLNADYTFLSEGIISVREVGFLLAGEQVTEGYGDLEEVLEKSSSGIRIRWTSAMG